jgi:hypothetical protein
MEMTVMNRRTLLKGAAATAAVGAIGTRRPSKSMAARRVRLIQQELPMYEIVSFYVSDQFVQVGDQSWRGVARDIANDGTIFGDTVVDGIMTPTFWDANLLASYPDMGPYAGQHAYGEYLNQLGRQIGVLIPASLFMTEGQAQGVDADVTFLFWDNGLLNTQLSGALPPNSGINTLTESGLILGTMNNIPTRWIDDVAKSLTMPDGYTVGGFRSVNAAGDTAGTIYRNENPSIGGVPLVLSAGGELTLFDPPAGDRDTWAGRLQVFDLSDDGSFAAIVRGEEDLFGQAYRYTNGTPAPIADLNGEGMFVRDANANGVMVGQSMLNGISIPTMWVDDQPQIIADLIVPGPDLVFMNVEAINDAGAMVGEGQDSAGVMHHVVLRPV